MHNTTCSIDGCERTVRARGWCQTHYMQRRRSRTLPARPSALDRFWRKVDKHGTVPVLRPELGPCWLWTAYVRPDGYGQLSVGGRAVRAHRWLYEQVVGPVPADLDLDHLCRVRHCVNPSHLEPVTHQENMRRGTTGAVTRARQLAKTHCSQGHLFDEANTYRTPDGRRNCRTCRRAAVRRHQVGGESIA